MLSKKRDVCTNGSHLADPVQLRHPEEELGELGRHRRIISVGVLLQGLHDLLLRITNVFGLLHA